MTRLRDESIDVESIGKGTREWLVDVRACPLLKMYGMLVVGISDAAAGFRFLRNKPSMSVLMACTAGRGNALIDGERKAFRPGMAFLMPPRVQHGYEAVGRGVWRVSWVCYAESAEQEPPLSPDKPKLVPAEAGPLEQAIQGLFLETMGHGAPSIQKLYLELIREHALRIARNPHADERLEKLWSFVEADLARNWTLEELARKGGMSAESLRTLSNQFNGRSPMKHITLLRMQKAAVALRSSRIKISALAETLGYNDPFAFSVAFKRHIGTAPAAYRSQKRSISIH